MDELLRDGLATPEAHEKEERIVNQLALDLQPDAFARYVAQDKNKQHRFWVAVAASLLVALPLGLFAKSLIWRSEGPGARDVAGEGDPKPGEGEKDSPAPVPPAQEAEQRFDSSLYLEVILPDDAYRTIGKTPTADWKGVRIPPKTLWAVRPREEDLKNGGFARALAKELLEKGVPGLDLSEVGPVGNGEFLDPFKALPSLRYLVLPGANGACLERLNALTHLKRLNVGGISADGLKQLKSFPHLEELNIGGRELDDRGLEQIGGLAGLSVLRLYSESITDAGLPHLARLMNLKVLEMGYSKISETGLKALKDLPLEYLRFAEYSYPDPHLCPRTVQSAVFERLPWLIKSESPSKPSLSADEARVVELSLKHLDAEDFASRERAQKDLVNLGLKARTVLATRLDEIAKGGDASPELRNGLAKVIEGIDRAEIGKEIQAALKAEEPKRGFSNERWVKEKLKRKISFDFVDTPLKDALARLSLHAGVPIVTEKDLDLTQTISLKVSDMWCELALEWTLRLADLDYGRQGRAIVVGKKKFVVGPLIRWTLPVAPGEAPWTPEETRAFAPFLLKFPMRREEEGVDGPSFKMVVVVDEWQNWPFEAGKIWVRESDLPTVQDFFRPLAEKPSLPQAPEVPAWLKQLEARLDQAESVSTGKKAITLEEFVPDLAKQTQVNILLDPKAVAEGSGKRNLSGFGGARAREAVLQICARAGLAAVIRSQCLLITKPGNAGLGGAPAILDLRPALKAGVSVKELEARLTELLRETPNPHESLVLRGHWLGMLDPWTERRAVQVLQEAAKNGKVPPAPPAPWFFATFKNKAIQAQPARAP